jgi:hypothetical protein
MALYAPIVRAAEASHTLYLLTWYMDLFVP